jgi:Flp pilus assembly pilin Flp
MFRDERGQATAEYALVVVAAATIALALISWAAGSDLLPSLFNTVVQKVIGLVG